MITLFILTFVVLFTTLFVIMFYIPLIKKYKALKDVVDSELEGNKRKGCDADVDYYIKDTITTESEIL